MKRLLVAILSLTTFFMFFSTVNLKTDLILPKLFSGMVVNEHAIIEDTDIPEVKGILSWINTNRKTPLRYSQFLTDTASIRACDMFKKQLWSHDGYVNYLWGEGYKGADIGENLARHFDNDEAVYNAWLNSPSHKKVMTNDKFKYVGIGHCGDYVVAHFGTTIR